LGSGIIDDYNDDEDSNNPRFNPNNKYHREHRDRSEKIFGDLLIPVYDWQALDMGKGHVDEYVDYFPNISHRHLDDDDDDDTVHRHGDDPEKEKARHENKKLNLEKNKQNKLEYIDDDPPLYQQLWNGDYYHEQLLESYDSMRVFIPGLSNISPCTQTHFNLEQIQKVTYRD